MGLPKFGHMYRLTREPSIAYANSGVAICKVGLACSEKYNDKEAQLFIDVTAFKKTAEMLNTVQKGHRIFAVLKLQTESWDDKDSGQKRSKTVAILENFEFIEPKQQNQQQAPPQQQSGGFQQPQYKQKQENTGYQNSNNHQQPQQGPQDDHIPFACNIV